MLKDFARLISYETRSIQIVVNVAVKAEKCK
jgi:hypothetical protein